MVDMNLTCVAFVLGEFDDEVKTCVIHHSEMVYHSDKRKICNKFEIDQFECRSKSGSIPHPLFQRRPNPDSNHPDL